jgi:MFS family permease
MKLVTWAAGIVGVPIGPFLACIVVGRGKRVYLVAGAIRWGGERAEAALRKHIEWIGWLGLALLVAADLVLAAAASPLVVFAGAALWGLHMAFTQGLLSKLVADTAPAELLGTGFGIFNLVSGGALLAASVLAGALWSSLGAAATFLAGAAFPTVAAAGLLATARRRGRPAPS